MSTSPAGLHGPERGRLLLELARASLAETFGGPKLAVPEADWLCAHTASFVTLTSLGALRGCIGTVEPRRPLGEDVVHNARAAAFADPRFSPMLKVELPQVRIEVTVLSSLVPLEATSERQALERLRVGEHGVVLEWGARRAVFIPQMWQKLPDPATFLAYLREKAGLPRWEWLDGTRLSVFTAQCWEEADGASEAVA